MNDTNTPGERRFTGRHMLLWICGLFGVTIAVNGLLAFLAVGSWTGLVVENSYVASQEYNEVLDEARRQDRLGWTSEFRHAKGFVRIYVRNARGRLVEGLKVTARLSVPAHEHRDHDVPLTHQPDGSYGAAASLEPGQWQADVTAGSPTGESYRQVFRFFVRQGA